MFIVHAAAPDGWDNVSVYDREPGRHKQGKYPLLLFGREELYTPTQVVKKINYPTQISLLSSAYA